MDSTITMKVRITHSQNLPGAQHLADEVGKLLTWSLAADPNLLATATLDGFVHVQSTQPLSPAEPAHPVVMPRRIAR